MQIMQKVCGSFNCPPIMPNMGHLQDQYRKVCTVCCQLDPKQRVTAGDVVTALKEILDSMEM